MKFVQIGTVYVDSGLLMIGDPCYTVPDDASGRSEVAKNWERFCQVVDDARYSEPFGGGAGIVLHTAWGDGRYPVMAEMTKHGCIARLIVDLDRAGYLEDDDCDEDWDEDDDE